ncbi:hypothetical protein SLE2022_034450 [Rubroshorea leprosula]
MFVAWDHSRYIGDHNERASFLSFIFLDGVQPYFFEEQSCCLRNMGGSMQEPGSGLSLTYSEIIKGKI